MASEEQIRHYAYRLWEKAGRPEGQDAEFWQVAKVELDSEDESLEDENPDAPDQPNRRTVPG